MTGTGSVDVTVGIDQSCLQVSVASAWRVTEVDVVWKTAEGEDLLKHSAHIQTRLSTATQLEFVNSV